MKYQVPEIVVADSDEFQEMIDEKDFRIAQAIVEGILHNLEGTKKHVHLLSVVCTDEGSIYEITIERKHFAETLEENIIHYVREELYEDCQRIANVINELKGKEVSKILNQVSSSKK
jgi:hypothetical protein